MEFDKSKVFTPFNCDEVKVGSKGFFADSKDILISRVTLEDKDLCHTLVEDDDDATTEYCFKADNDAVYRFFYLVEEPKEKTNRPCTREELLEMLRKQGLPMLRCKTDYSLYITDVLHSDVCSIDGFEYTYEKLCEHYTLIDGTELWVEE